MNSTRLKALQQPRRHLQIQRQGADIEYIPGFLEPGFADLLMTRLEASINWRQDDIVLFGRRVAQPRLTAWVADPGVAYTYSGLTLQPGAWTSELTTLRQRLTQQLDVTFNSVLLNLYRHGRDSMGWHRDNEKALGEEPVIASISLGAARHFDLRHRLYRELELAPMRFSLEHGDLLIMRGATQQHWQHRVPRRAAGEHARINLSFRNTRG